MDDADLVALIISSSRRTLFTGSNQGQVYTFVLPDTSDNCHLLREDKFRECMLCKKSFSVLKRKTHCRTCGGKWRQEKDKEIKQIHGMHIINTTFFKIF